MPSTIFVHRRAPLVAVFALLAIGLVVALAPARAQDGDGDPADNADNADGPAARNPLPWFVNVATDLGLDGAQAFRAKWTDLNGDGWVDLLILDWGRSWRVDFLADVGFDDEIVTSGAFPLVDEVRQIARDDWPGDDTSFSLIDLDEDGTVTQAELNLISRQHGVRLYFSAPREGTDGATATDRVFVERTVQAGIHANVRGDARARSAMVFVAGDVDNDGDLDLFSGANCDLENPGNKDVDLGDRSSILLNDGSGTFTLLHQKVPPPNTHGPAAYGPSAFPDTTCAATFVDIDNDGRLDLFTGAWYRQYGVLYDSYPDRLYRGLGDGTFNDITFDAGLALEGSPFHMLTEAEQRSGNIPEDKLAQIGRGATRPTYGVAHSDWDNDGDQDLFVMAYGRQWNLHWRNDLEVDAEHDTRDPHFVEIGEATHFDGDDARDGKYPAGINRQTELPFRSNGNTFSSHFGDYDNDGNIDCVLSEIRHWWAGAASDTSMILRNLGPDAQTPFAFDRKAVPLVRAHEGDRWNEGDIHVGWIDVDNDGWLDLLLASSDYPDAQLLRLYRQDPETHQFEEVPTNWTGFNWRCPTQISFADFDRDGDLDILCGNTHTRLTAEQREELPLSVAVFRNDYANRCEHSFLSLSLQGVKANRAAIGARVIVTAGGMTQTREISGGHGHVGMQHDLRVVIGLGKATKIDRVEIHWGGPAGTVDVHENVPINRFLRAVEGTASLTPDTPRATTLPE